MASASSTETGIWTRRALFRDNETNRSACTPEDRRRLIGLYDIVAILERKRVDNLDIGVHALCSDKIVSIAAGLRYDDEADTWVAVHVSNGHWSTTTKSLVPNAQWGLLRLFAYRYHQVKEILKLNWPNYMHESKMWQGLKTEGYYMYTVMDNLKRELKNRDRDPNTRLPLLDAWMFFEILTKNTINSWAQVLEDDAFADQTVVLEDMDELDDYLRTTEIADPRWWVCLDEETADEWWNQLTDAGWVVGDMPDENNNEAWMSIPPLQQGLRVYKEAEDDLRTYGPFPSHVVTVYKVSVLNVLRMKSEQQAPQLASGSDNMDEHEDEDGGDEDGGDEARAKRADDEGKGKADEKGKGKADDKGKGKAEKNDKVNKEAESESNLREEARANNARPRAPTITSPRAGEKKKRPRRMTSHEEMVSDGQDDVQMGDMNNEDEEMEEGEIRGTPEVSEVPPAREHSPLSEVPPPEDGSAQRVDSAQVAGGSKEYVRPHSPVPLPPWDDKLTEMLIKEGMTGLDPRMLEKEHRWNEVDLRQVARRTPSSSQRLRITKTLLSRQPLAASTLRVETVVKVVGSPQRAPPPPALTTPARPLSLQDCRSPSPPLAAPPRAQTFALLPLSTSIQLSPAVSQSSRPLSHVAMPTQRHASRRSRRGSLTESSDECSDDPSRERCSPDAVWVNDDYIDPARPIEPDTRLPMASAPVHSESDYDATLPPSSPQEQTSEDDGIPGPSRARHTGSQRSPSVDSSSVPSEKSGEVESDNGDIWTVEALMSERSVDDSGESEVSQRSPSVDEDTTTTVQHKTWVGGTFMRMLGSVGSLQSGDNEVPWKWPLPNNAPPVVMTGWNSASNFVTRMQAGGSVSILSDDPVPYHPEVRRTKKARGQTTTGSKDSSAKERTTSAPTRHKMDKRSGSRASTAVKGKKRLETEDVGSVFLQELADKAKAAVALIEHWPVDNISDLDHWKAQAEMVFDAMVWGKKICAKWENNTDGSWKYRVRDYILMNDATLQLKTRIAELELPLWIITIMYGTRVATHPCAEDHKKLVDWTEEILMTLWRVRWLGDADSLLVWGDNVDLKIMPTSLVTRAERAMKEWSADCLIEWPADATMM